MANKMAEFPEKLAIFWQKRPRFARPRGGGGSPENLKTQGGYFGYTPPLLTPAFHYNAPSESVELGDLFYVVGC